MGERVALHSPTRPKVSRHRKGQKEIFSCGKLVDIVSQNGNVFLLNRFSSQKSLQQLSFVEQRDSDFAEQSLRMDSLANESHLTL